MNTDDSFENRLKATPPRRLPTGWRAEILGAAREAAARGERRAVEGNRGFALPAWLTGLLGPHPKAWAGLAAVWVVIIGLNLANRDGDAEPRAELSAPPSPQMRAMLQQQEQLFVELVGDVAEPERPRSHRPQPHSRREEDFIYT
jgi:hypothetical protein